jgi:AcrR family transcriptional regulator
MITVTMTVKGRRQEYKELTRAAVLDAAAEEFVGQGFAGTTIDDVARRARISKGAVYYHFADKAELFEAVFRDRQARLLENVVAALDGLDAQATPWDELQTGLDAYLDGAIADAAHRVLLQQAPAALGVERCRRLDQEMAIPVLRAVLERLVTADEPGQSVEMLTRVLFSALCEAAMVAGADPDPTRARNDAAAILKTITSGLRRATP